MRMILPLLVAAGLIAAAPAVAQSSGPIPEPRLLDGRAWPAYEPLISELRRGGLVLLIRHERTDLDPRWDLQPYAEGDCRRQRNLSRIGRESARSLGEALKLLGIPIGPVVTSTYCRAADTARLGFARIDLRTSKLIGADGKMRTFAHVRADVMQVITEHGEPERTLALVGHSHTLNAFSELYFDEGDALILRPRVGADPEIVGRMPAARWDEIVRDERRREAGF